MFRAVRPYDPERFVERLGKRRTTTQNAEEKTMATTQATVQEVSMPDPFTQARAVKTEIQLREFLRADPLRIARLCVGEGEDRNEMLVPHAAIRILADILGVLGRGHRVTIAPVPPDPSTSQNHERIWEPIGLEY